MGMGWWRGIVLMLIVKPLERISVLSVERIIKWQLRCSCVSSTIPIARFRARINANSAKTDTKPTLKEYARRSHK